ncbi:MAG: hypothetical protein A2044_05650 [Candidatus Firestonebacteria bacterium GWA2_43_8]|nr:MAG: hypothetical protein A2044_05650 [Candidatus Firestonebacteria bacterium GWA2_43_8]
MSLKTDKWKKWIEEIRTDLQNTLINRHIFKRTQEILKANTELTGPSDFNVFLAKNYIAGASMGARRHIKSGDGSISLMGLLEDIRDNCEIEASALFKSIKRDEVEKDIVELGAISKKIEDFADKRIAHLDPRELKGAPTFGELHVCMDHMADLFKKYLLIIAGVDYIQIEPAMQYSWEEIFTKPWKKQEDDK